MAIDTKVKDEGTKVIERMYAAHKELQAYQPNHALLPYLSLDLFGRLTLTTEIIRVKTFLQRFDGKDANPITPLLNYTKALEKAVKQLDACAYHENS
jgi:hypothetical protein